MDKNGEIKTCAWCETTIWDKSEFFTVGARARQDADIMKHKGEIIPLLLIAANKSVQAVVVTNDSEAKKEGIDLVFLVCSRECGEYLKEALEIDNEIIESVSTISPNSKTD